MFNFDGFFSNLIAEIIGILGAATLTVAVLERLRIWRERDQWRRLRGNVIQPLSLDLRLALYNAADCVGKNPDTLHKYLLSFAENLDSLPDAFLYSLSNAEELLRVAEFGLREFERFPSMASFEPEILAELQVMRQHCHAWLEAIHDRPVDPEGDPVPGYRALQAACRLHDLIGSEAASMSEEV